MGKGFATEPPNGLRNPLVGGRGQGLKAEKTQSQRKAPKTRRVPHIGCTLCWAGFPILRTRFNKLKALIKAISLTSYYVESTKGVLPQPSVPGIDNFPRLSLTRDYFFSPGQGFG
jgi:hypothetical protein